MVTLKLETETDKMDVSVHDLPIEGLVVNVPEANYEIPSHPNTIEANEMFPKIPVEQVGRIWDRQSHYHPDFSTSPDPREDGPARVVHTFKMHQLKLGAEELKNVRLFYCWYLLGEFSSIRKTQNEH